jgi:hypothetical protein
MTRRAFSSDGHVHGLLRIGLLVLTLVGSLATDAAVSARNVQSTTEDGTNALTDMLARVPAELPELDDPGQAITSYADIAAQLDAVGVEAPESFEDEEFGRWMRATYGLAMPVTPAQYFQRFRQDFGFDLLQAAQTLEISAPPFSLTLYRGDFDEDAVLDALQEQGYRAGAIEGRRAFSVRGDFEQDVRATAFYTFASMNYMTILDDGTLVFAPARSIIDAVIAVDEGDAPSLAEERGVAALVEHAPADLVSASLVPGGLLAGDPLVAAMFPEPGATPSLDIYATEQAELRQMPRVALALLGETAGGPLPSPPEGTPEPLTDDAPTGRAFIGLLMPGPAAAEDAVPIIEERLATGVTLSDVRPFADIFPDPTVTAIPDEALVLIDLPFGETQRGILLRLLITRDLSFIAWG